MLEEKREQEKREEKKREIERGEREREEIEERKRRNAEFSRMQNSEDDGPRDSTFRTPSWVRKLRIYTYTCKAASSRS